MNIWDYRAYNKSCKKTLIFHFGSGAGFFSEYNNMLKAIAYCLIYRIKFELYSADAQIAPKSGWQNYFVPFTDEVFEDFHSEYNRRTPETGQTQRLWRFVKYNTSAALKWKSKKQFIRYAPFYKDLEVVQHLKEKYGFQYFTYDLWDDFFRLKPGRKVRIKGLFEGTVGELLYTIDEMIWVFNEKTSSEISALINQLNVPENYVGMHMRGGDKHVEASIFGHGQYFEVLDKKDSWDQKSVFIASDDYRNYQLAVKNYPQFTIYTLCEPEDQGYFHRSFMSQDQETIRERMINFFASIEVLKQSNRCIGTISSNVGKYLKLKLPENAFHSLD